MKKKILAMLCCMTMIAAALTGCGNKAESTEQATADDGGASAGSDTKIALITMDSVDQHWIGLNVRQHMETLGGEHFGSFQGFNGVGE